MKQDRTELGISIHGILRRSAANGPGTRAVVWVQGCSIRCAGCFNPDTHATGGGTLWEPDALAEHLASPRVAGVTVTGGEPLDQAPAVIEFLNAWERRQAGTIILLTGYQFESIPNVIGGDLYEDLANLVDVLIAGPFRWDLLRPRRLAGSSNKTFHFLSNRHRLPEFDEVPDAEVLISANGTVVSSGISRPRLDGHDLHLRA